MTTIIQPPWQTGYPVLMADGVTLDLTLAAGVTKQCNSQKLSNTYNTAVAIDEIRFYVRPTAPAVTAGTTNEGANFDFGSFIKAKVSVNNLHLMQNFVTIRSLGKLWQSELQWGGYKQTYGVLPNARFFVYNETYYAWRFPEPLWIGRQGALDIQIQAEAAALRPNDPSDAVPSVNVYVAAVGRLQPVSQPMMVAYPYVAEFESGALSVRNGSSLPAFSMASDPVFRNPFMNPITIERFTNSLYVTSTDSTLRTDLLNSFPDVITMRLTDGRGNVIGGGGGANPVPMGDIVDPRSGEWTVNRVLDAYQFLYCELYANSSTSFVTQPNWFPRVAFAGTHLAQLVP